MTKGWASESARHALAAKGIESGSVQDIEKVKKSLYPISYKDLKETCPKTASPAYRKLWANLIKGLTDKEFERWRYYIYLTPKYTLSFRTNPENRFGMTYYHNKFQVTRDQWAKDKANYDVSIRTKIIKRILEGNYG